MRQPLFIPFTISELGMDIDVFPVGFEVQV
jgi:hypothetical protein